MPRPQLVQGAIFDAFSHSEKQFARYSTFFAAACAGFFVGAGGSLIFV